MHTTVSHRRLARDPMNNMSTRAHRRSLFVLLGSSLVAATTYPSALYAAPLVRIGVLRFGNEASGKLFLEAFKLGLRDLGYIDGKNFALDARYADGRVDRLPALAAELVKLRVSILLVTDTPSGLAARTATTTIPIVFATATDPVASGLVASLSRPGGNATGLSNLTSDISSKHLELLATMTGQLSLVAVLANPANPSNRSIWNDVQYASGQTGIKAVLFEADSPEKIESAFAAMVNSHSDGVIVALDPFFAQQQSQIASLALKSRLPSIAATANYVEAGLLMSYGQDLAENYRRAATYCDRIDPQPTFVALN
jgi:putative tryptophan/tyrosine transport system substrate-binding protein